MRVAASRTRTPTSFRSSPNTNLVPVFPPTSFRSSRLYLLGDGKLMRSLDDGASWAQVAPLPFEKGCSRPTVLDRQVLVLCEFADAPKYGLFAIDTSKLSKPKKP